MNESEIKVNRPRMPRNLRWKEVVSGSQQVKLLTAIIAPTAASSKLISKRLLKKTFFFASSSCALRLEAVRGRAVANKPPRYEIGSYLSCFDDTFLWMDRPRQAQQKRTLEQIWI